MISVSVLITEVMVLLARSSLLQFTLVGMSLYSNILSPGHNKINKLAYKNRCKLYQNNISVLMEN